MYIPVSVSVCLKVPTVAAQAQSEFLKSFIHSTKELDLLCIWCIISSTVCLFLLSPAFQPAWQDVVWQWRGLHHFEPLGINWINRMNKIKSFVIFPSWETPQPCMCREGDPGHSFPTAGPHGCSVSASAGDRSRPGHLREPKSCLEASEGRSRPWFTCLCVGGVRVQVENSEGPGTLVSGFYPLSPCPSNPCQVRPHPLGLAQLFGRCRPWPGNLGRMWKERGKGKPGVACIFKDE